MQLRRHGPQLLVLLMTLTAFEGEGTTADLLDPPWPCPPTTNLTIARTGQPDLLPECKAGLDGISALPYLVNDKNAPMLGFKNHDEVSLPGSVTIGEPFQLYEVDLLDLRRFNPASDKVTDLLKLNTSLVIYPLLTKRQEDGPLAKTRAAVVVSKQKDTTWRPTNWGLAELAKAMAAYRDRVGFSSGIVVWIPALNLHFLADDPHNEHLLLIPLADRLAYGLRKGEAISAKIVFTFYAREASSLDENNPG